MIRERKGIAVETMLWMLLAVFVLVLVGLGFSKLITGHWIPDFIPEFNQTRVGTEGIALVRYVITDDRLDYYDGAKWRAFGDAPRELNKNVYDGVALRTALRDAYVDTGRQRRMLENVELIDGYYAQLHSIIPYPDGAYERGDVEIVLWKHDGAGGVGQVQDSYVLRGAAGAVVRIGRSGSDFLGSNVVAQREVQRRAIAWRERALEKPAHITSKDTTGIEHDLYVCLSRTTGTQELVVDLDRDVGVSGTCKV